MSSVNPLKESVPVLDHRRFTVLPYYVRLRRLRRDGRETVDLFDTFDAAVRWLERELEDEEYYEDIQTVTLDCISGAHVRPEEQEQDDA